jgi:hypothetical protein
MIGLCLQYSLGRKKQPAGEKGKRQRDCIRFHFADGGAAADEGLGASGAPGGRNPFAEQEEYTCQPVPTRWGIEKE